MDCINQLEGQIFVSQPWQGIARVAFASRNFSVTKETLELAGLGQGVS